MLTKILLAVKDDTQNHCMITSATTEFCCHLVRSQSAMSTQKLIGHVYIQELSVVPAIQPAQVRFTSVAGTNITEYLTLFCK